MLKITQENQVQEASSVDVWAGLWQRVLCTGSSAHVQTIRRNKESRVLVSIQEVVLRHETLKTLGRLTSSLNCSNAATENLIRFLGLKAGCYKSIQVLWRHDFQGALFFHAVIECFHTLWSSLALISMPREIDGMCLEDHVSWSDQITRFSTSTIRLESTNRLVRRSRRNIGQ
jgi:hypothetical protein